MRWAAAATLLGAALLASPAAAQFCPCYTLSSSNNNNNCGVEAVNGSNPSQAEWNDIFDLVSRGPAVWGSAGPAVGDIGQGCGKPEPIHDVPARFPCELLKAITQVESGWKQFCVPTTPGDQVGGPERTIISFDCGYGIAQVTSGMHIGENPAFDRARVAAEPTYNLAAGTLILASKWRNTQCVGDNQPRVIEDWYSATWAYNGLAYINNPNNPNYSPSRGVYNPANGGSAPYQEKVFGRIENTSGWFDATPLAYPNPGDIGGGSSPPELPEPACASPTNCSSTRSTHETACQDGGGGVGGDGGQGGDGQGGLAAGGASASSSGGGSGGSSSSSSGSEGGEGLAAGAGPNGVAAGDDDALVGYCACRAVGRRTDDRGQLAWLALAALGAAAGALRRPRRRRR